MGRRGLRLRRRDSRAAPRMARIEWHGNHSKYTVRIAHQVSRYNPLVLYLGAAGCVRHVPVQYHTIIAAEPPRTTRCALVTGPLGGHWHQLLGELGAGCLGAALRSDLSSMRRVTGLSGTWHLGDLGTCGRDNGRQVLRTLLLVRSTSTTARAHPFFAREGGSRLISKHRLPVPSITVW